MTRRRAFAALLVVALGAFYALLAHLNYWPGGVWGRPKGWALSAPTSTGGDEPHYLVIANSLLFDGDIELQDDFLRIQAGGYEAGIAYKGVKFGGHAYLWNRRTRAFALCVVDCLPEDVAALGGPGEPLVQVPSHPAAFGAFLALLAAPLRPSPAGVEARLGVMLALLAAAGVALTYLAARLSGQRTRAALASAALLGFASPWLVYLRSYFVDVTLGFFMLLGFLAMRRRMPVLAGLSIGVAMAMKSILLLAGFAWIAERLWARARREAFVLTATIGLAGLALLAVNRLTIPELLASGAMRITAARSLDPMFYTFFEREHGLFSYVPWAVAPLVWGPVSLVRPPKAQVGLLGLEARRQMVLATFAIVLVFSAVSFGPGWCYGPRFYIPVMPYLAILAVDWALVARRWERAMLAALAVWGAVVAFPSVVQYHWLFSRGPFDAIVGPERPPSYR